MLAFAVVTFALAAAVCLVILRMTSPPGEDAGRHAAATPLWKRLFLAGLPLLVATAIVVPWVIGTPDAEPTGEDVTPGSTGTSSTPATPTGSVATTSSSATTSGTPTPTRSTTGSAPAPEPTSEPAPGPTAEPPPAPTPTQKPRGATTPPTRPTPKPR